MTPGFFARHKLRTSFAAGATTIVLGIGGFAIAHAASGSGTLGAVATSNGASSQSASTSSPSSSGSASASANPGGQVIPFQQGQQGASKQVGQVPAGWQAGSGTIVTGTAADKAKAAAMAAYPGGTVNRVVLLSNGEYNVHVIAVNWPHHVFVSSTFTVVGAA
jgi:hypothetical protein